MFLNWHDLQTVAWWMARFWTGRVWTSQPSSPGARSSETPWISEVMDFDQSHQWIKRVIPSSARDASHLHQAPPDVEHGDELRFTWWSDPIYGTALQPEPDASLSPKSLQLVWCPLGAHPAFRADLENGLTHQRLEESEDVLSYLTHPRGFFHHLERVFLEQPVRCYVEDLDRPWWVVVTSDWQPDPPSMDVLYHPPASDRMVRLKVVFERTYTTMDDPTSPSLARDLIRWSFVTIPVTAWWSNQRSQFESHPQGWGLLEQEGLQWSDQARESLVRFILQAPS